MSDEETRALERRAEATGAPEDDRALLLARARAGDEEARKELQDLAREEWEAQRRARPVSEWTPCELADSTKNRLGYNDPRYLELEQARETIEDEIAEARAMGRRGEPPRAWRPNVVGLKLGVFGESIGHETAPDPRLVAWREAAWEKFRNLMRSLGAWNVADKAPSLDGIIALEKTMETAHKATTNLRAQCEQERGI